MKKDKQKLELKKLIENKSMQILRFLNLGRKNSNIVEQLEIILKIYKYVVQNVHPNTKYTQNNSNNKEEEYLNNLYIGLTDNPGLSVTNSILFKHLLYMKGFESYIILSKSRSGSMHISNLVKVGKEFFYFDTTLERSIFEEQAINDDDLLFCCAALGKNEYSKFYKPVQILPNNFKKAIMQMPENISEESIPKQLIDSIIKILPNENIENNSFFNKCAEEEKINIFGFTSKIS